MKTSKKTLVLICSVLLLMLSISSIYFANAAPQDENFDDDGYVNFGYVSTFTDDGIKYTVDGTALDTFITNDSTSPLGNDGSDYYMNVGTNQSLTIESEDGSNFKFNGLSIDVLADSKVSIKPNGVNGITLSSYNVYVTQEIDLSSNSEFYNVSSVTISGTNMLLSIDDLNFEEPVLPPTYTVSYNGNNNTSGIEPADNNSYENGQNVTVLGQNSLAKYGYNFMGWNTEYNGSGSSYYEGNSFSMGSNNVTLYAMWAPAEYTVTYNGNNQTSGEVPVDGTIYYIYESATVLSNSGNLQKEGYVFNGWNTNDDGNGISYKGGDTFSISSNTTLYANWVDNTPPNAPTITSINPDSGASSSDRITKVNNPIINGTAEQNSTVEVFSNLVSIGETTTDVTGNWSFNASLSEGNHSLTAVATDQAGNTGLFSTEFIVVIDTTSPEPPLIQSITDDSGEFNDDAVTSDDTPTFIGTAEPNSYVEIYNANTFDSWGLTQADSEGNWSVNYNGGLPNLSENAYGVIGVSRDIAGNKSLESNVFGLTIDQTSPTINNLNPSDNTLNVGINDNVTITFDEPVYLGSGNIVLKKHFDDTIVESISVVDSNISGDGTKEITIDFDTTLGEGTRYYIQIESNVFKDLAGNSYFGIADKTSWDFTTAIYKYRIINSGSAYEVFTGLSGGEFKGAYSTFIEALNSINGTDLTIQFGDGINPLPIPTTSTVVNVLPQATYKGKVVSVGNLEYLFVLKDEVEVNFENIEITNVSSYYSGGNASKAVFVTGSNTILNINGANTYISSLNNAWSIHNFGGVININNGVIISGPDFSYAIKHSSGILNINGGKVTSIGSAIPIMSHSTLNILDGIVEATEDSDAIMVYANTTNISGGSIKSVSGNAIDQLGSSSEVNISGEAIISSSMEDTIYRTGGSTNITGGVIESLDSNSSSILHRDGVLDISSEAKVISKSDNTIKILSINPDDTTSTVISGVTIWNKEDATISIYGAYNNSTEFYEFSNESSDYAINNSNIYVSYVKSPYVFDKWATTADRDIAIEHSARNMKIGTNEIFYLDLSVMASYKVEHYQYNGATDTYELADTKTFEGIVGRSVSAEEKEYIEFEENTTFLDRVPTGIVSEDGSLTLKLFYDRKKYTVNFNDYNGEVLKTEIVQHGNAATPPPTPTREGHTFSGWSADYSNVTGELNVDAEYIINQYEVSFDTNGGSLINTLSSNYGSIVAEPTVPEKIGHDFLGWYKESSLTNEWDFESDLMLAENITLYAKWTIKNYTITFKDYNGEVLKSELVEHGNGAAAPTTPTREGHTFDGWDIGYNEVASDLIITAEYTVNQYYITFDSNGGSNVGPIVADYDSTITPPPTPTKEGYAFLGWYKDSLLTNEWDFESDTVPAELVTLYGKWIEEYTVTFVDYDNTEIKAEKVVHGQSATAPASPSREDYVFIEWDNEFNSITSDLIVKANYELLYLTADKEVVYEGENVSFTTNAPGKNLAAFFLDRQFWGYGTIETTPNPFPWTLIGEGSGSDVIATYRIYDFEHYGYRTNDKVSEITWETPFLKEINVLFKRDTKVPADKVNLIYLAGENGSIEGEANQQVGYESSGSEVTAVANEGYHFASWSDGVKTASRTDANVISALEVTATFAINEYTVTFIAYNESIYSEDILEHGTKAIKPTNPSRSGYTFINWYENESFSNEYDFDLPVKKDKTIYARWRRNSTKKEDDAEKEDLEEDLIVLVNGQEEKAGKAIIEEEAGEKIVKFEVDSDVVNKKIEDVIANPNGNQGSKDNVLEISILKGKAENTKTNLTGDVVKKMDDNDFNLSITSDEVSYIIPAKEVGIERVAKNLGVEYDLRKIEVDVLINKVDENLYSEMEQRAKDNSYEVVFPPVSFEVVAKTISTNGEEKQVKVSRYNQYVERIMKLPENSDPSKITTGIVYNSDGTFAHVPTVVFEKDGVYYARINSLTNSIYSLISNEIEVESVSNHWAKTPVNALAKRLIIKNPEQFDPNDLISRGAFAEYITKAIGVYRSDIKKVQIFNDITADNEHFIAISIANDYGIISGYPEGDFRSNQTITRQEAMAMFSNTMNVINSVGSDLDRIEQYQDKEKVSPWAYESVKNVLAAKVFNGKSVNTIAPKDTITYAEAVTAIWNLLVENELINK